MRSRCRSTGEFELLDPHGGVADLVAALLRLLHERSIADDPTRALRAARYAARLGLEVEQGSLEQIRAADLGTVSEQRREAELRRIAAERRPRAALELLADWGLIELPPAGGDRIDSIVAPARRACLGRAAAARRRGPRGPRRGRPARWPSSPALAPGSPSEAVAAAHGRPAVDLALARVLGAEWLDDYVSRWRQVRAEISGADLLAAGVPEGPGIGRGLAAALQARLDGEAETRDDELRIALDAAQ